MLQSDTQSLSLVVPALLDLQGHLTEFSRAQGAKDLSSLAKKMKTSMDKRFSCFLDHTDSTFSPLTAAACFLDYISRSVPPVVREEKNPARNHWKSSPDSNSYQNQAGHSGPASLSQSHVSRTKWRSSLKEQTVLEFWAAQGDCVNPSLKPIALDLLAMPASQAFAERVFSVTGDLSCGRRNRATVIWERSAFLKLNRRR